MTSKGTSNGQRYPLKVKKTVHKNCRTFKGKHSCFPVNIAKLLRALILKSICEWLLVKISD